jgi:Mg-chelatase subunit ChlD
MSAAEVEARRSRGSFLQPPGSTAGDRYGSNSLDDPPWRQINFFGVRARGQFFVFVADHSESMLDDDRLTRTKIELRRSVFALQEPQRFEVIFFNHEATPLPGGPIPRPADQRQKEQLTTWLRLVDASGATDPQAAIQQALALRPDAVFLVTDGEFPIGTVEAIGRLNTRKIPIHCIDLGGGAGAVDLLAIARESGGRYVSRPGSLQATP